MPFAPRPIRFGPARKGAAPEPLLVRATRTVARSPAADSALARLPAPGEALHVLMTGRYDLTELVAALVGRVGAVERMAVSTLSFSADNLATLLGLLDSGRVEALTLLACTFFRNCNKRLWGEALAEFRRRGQRLAAARVHCKVVTLACASGDRFALEGSSNLRNNDCWEQLAIVHDAGLHDFHAGWIGDLAARHEGDADEG
jgi:hypothetical protein